MKAKPSLIVLLVEDSRHSRLLFRYLRNLGFGVRELRIEESPAGAGSAEQWVRERFAVEVEACRKRHAETGLIVVTDADQLSVSQRRVQLDLALREAGVEPVPDERRHVAYLIPKRNVGTWLVCLNGEAVNEDTNYKRAYHRWDGMIGPAARNLYEWGRPNTEVPVCCVESLRLGIQELQRVGL